MQSTGRSTGCGQVARCPPSPRGRWGRSTDGSASLGTEVSLQPVSSPPAGCEER